MIKGILRGLARQFAIEIEVELTKSIAAGADHDEFTIRYVSQSGSVKVETDSESKIACRSSN